MALRLCRSSSGSVVGVDRVLVGLDAHTRIVAIGLPFGLNIAWQTWAAIGVSFEAARALGKYHDGKVYVDHQDFFRLTGMTTCPISFLTGAVVLTQLEEGARLGPDEWARGIRAHSLYGNDPGYLHDWIGLAGDPANLESEERILERWPIAKLAQQSVALQHRAGDDPPPVLQTLLL